MVKPMTDEDKQRYQASVGAPDKEEKKIALQAKAKMAIDDNQGENRLLLKSGESILKAHASNQDHQEAKDQNVQQMALQRAERIALQQSDAGFQEE